ncbi:MAG: hypothetical protein NC200_01770 [Candidatus Gastranaerophilales bacterium]|nr:hypothetical protein [Candidatus Gastranaerophilales bacterium]
MKNLFLFFILITASFQTAFAFDALFRKEYTPTYQQVDKTRSNYQLPSTKLHPQSNDRVQNQLRHFSQDPQGSPRYNSSCQFGVCMPGGPGSSMYNNNSKR